MNRSDALFEIVNKFHEKFRYDCEIPQNVITGKTEELKKFQELIEKCIKDNFDYTIKLYGTIPTPLKAGSDNDILID